MMGDSSVIFDISGCSIRNNTNEINAALENTIKFP